MESFLNRYRNITVLLLVVFAQLVLLAMQVRNDQDVRIIRVWTVTAVTPMARVMEWMRGGSIGFVRDYILLHDTHEQNQKLQAEVDRLKLENNFLKNEVNMADRAKALAIFQEHTPSKTVPANVIGSGAGTNSKVVFVDRGSTSGVQRGMAVVTPDGIVGTIIAAYPTASEVLLITDPDFAAGVVSQKTGIRGTLKGQGTPLCRVDYVPFEEKVSVGDWFYTSGDDRIFPRGFPVGVVKAVHAAQPFKEILVEPVGMGRGMEDVLILIEGVHQVVPNEQTASQPVYIAPAPTEAAATPSPAGQPAVSGTEADRLRAQYKAIGDYQKHTFGEGPPGTKPPDFNLKLPPAAGPGPGNSSQGPGARSQGPGNTPATQTPPASKTSSPAPGPRSPAPVSSSRPPVPAPGAATGTAAPQPSSPASSDVPPAERPRTE